MPAARYNPTSRRWEWPARFASAWSVAMAQRPGTLAAALAGGARPAGTLALALSGMADSGWRTINGAHVKLGDDGRIAIGPKALVGTHPSEHGHDGRPDGTKAPVPEGHLAAASIKPLHAVISKEKVAELAKRMKSDGWHGRPVLVMVDGKKNWALTGTHRIAAAKKAGIPVPVEKVSATELREAGDATDPDFLRATDDYDKEYKLRDAGFTKAADLLKAEIDANDADQHVTGAMAPNR